MERVDDFREKVFRAVAMVPEGRVASYAQVAELAGFAGAARAVGNALHLNTDPLRVPCHRVVHADGRLAEGYAFGGPEKQRERLMAEGVVFAFSGRVHTMQWQADSASRQCECGAGTAAGFWRVDMARCSIVIEDHPLEPFLPSNGRILFLGSFPPPKARWSMEFFYPNPQNDFWRIQGLLHRADVNHFILNGRKAFDCGSIKDFCNENGYGFYDTASRVCRLKGNASDEFLVILRPADVSGMLDAMPLCRTIVTTGGKSSDELAWILSSEGLSDVVPPPVGQYADVVIRGRAIRWWRMPSTSRAYPMKLEDKAALYRKVFLVAEE